jgi:hypothetical protein
MLHEGGIIKLKVETSLDIWNKALGPSNIPSLSDVHFAIRTICPAVFSNLQRQQHLLGCQNQFSAIFAFTNNSIVPAINPKRVLPAQRNISIRQVPCVSIFVSGADEPSTLRLAISL